jgi:hypothetical protein
MADRQAACASRAADPVAVNHDHSEANAATCSGCLVGWVAEPTANQVSVRRGSTRPSHRVLQIRRTVRSELSVIAVLDEALVAWQIRVSIRGDK